MSTTSLAFHVPARIERAVQTALLASGIAASALYMVMTIVCSAIWPDYSSTSQTISELSAVDAPSRPLWVALSVPYDVFTFAFAFGVWRAARVTHGLRVVAGLLLAVAVVNPFWPPMHMRGTPATLTDTMHLVFAGFDSVLFLLVIGFAANAFRRAFRVYSIATLAILVLFGFATFLSAPGVAANTATPWLGVYERVNVGAYMTWVAVLAIELMRDRRAREAVFYCAR